MADTNFTLQPIFLVKRYDEGLFGTYTGAKDVTAAIPTVEGYTFVAVVEAMSETDYGCQLNGVIVKDGVLRWSFRTKDSSTAWRSYHNHVGLLYVKDAIVETIFDTNE